MLLNVYVYIYIILLCFLVPAKCHPQTNSEHHIALGKSQGYSPSKKLGFYKLIRDFQPLLCFDKAVLKHVYIWNPYCLEFRGVCRVGV